MKVILTKEDMQAIVLRHLTDEGVLKDDRLYSASVSDYSRDYITVKEVQPEVEEAE